jgi:hypothetical protein
MIKNLAKLLAVSAVILVSTTLATRAAILSGTYTEDNMGALTPVWDLTGGYTNEDVSADLGTVGVTISNAPDGKLTGNGSIIVEDLIVKKVNFTYAATNVTIAGQVTGSNKKPLLILKLGYSTSGVIGGYTFKSLTQSFTGAFGLEDTNFVGKGVSDFKGSILDPKTEKYLTAFASVPVKDAEIALPAEADGSWALVLQGLTSTGSKYSGTAMVVTTGNEVDGFTVTGTYASKTDKSTLVLKGPKGSNCELTVVITDGSLTFDSINGKLLGQILNYKGSDKE